MHLELSALVSVFLTWRSVLALYYMSSCSPHFRKPAKISPPQWSPPRFPQSWRCDFLLPILKTFHSVYHCWCLTHPLCLNLSFLGTWSCLLPSLSQASIPGVKALRINELLGEECSPLLTQLSASAKNSALYLALAVSPGQSLGSPLHFTDKT